MEVLVLLIIVAILVILLGLNAIVRQHLKINQQERIYTQNLLKDIFKKIEDLEKGSITPKEVEEAVVPKEEPIKEVSHFDSIKQDYKKEQDINKELEKVKETTSQESPKQEHYTIPEIPKKEAPPIKPVQEPIKQVSEPRKTFLEKHPDLEKFIGENLINKIGIIIFVLGIGYFVKIAIDENWINEIGRVAIGVLSAGILIGIAHRLRKEYKAFSSVLIGGGLAILYFIISYAFHTEGYPLYQQQTATFIILVFITSFAVFLSILYDRVEIAILAIIGGFSSPMMVSNGSGNYIVLFSYMSVLNLGMLILAYFKKWRLVNIVAFGFTVLLFSLWLSNEIVNDKFDTFKGAIFFAAGFYLIFFLMNIIYNIKYKIGFKALDISLILVNTFAFFSFAMLMLVHINNGAYKGLFSVLLALFNFSFAYYAYKRQEPNKNLLYLLIGLVFTFITLAIPLQLEGNYITLFWSIESVLLLWLSQKSGFKIMKSGSVVVLILMLISLALDWANNYDIIGYYEEGYVKTFSIIINKMFITSFISGISLLSILFLLRKEKEDIAWVIPPVIYRNAIFIITLLVFFIGGLLELNYQTYHYFLEISSRESASFAYEAVFLLGVLIIAHKIKDEVFSSVISVISTLFILLFFVAISTIFSDSIYNYIDKLEILQNYLLIFRWIAILSVYAMSILLLKLVIKLSPQKGTVLFKAGVTFFIITILYLLSADLDAIGILITKNKDALSYSQKTGYAILWGISSFVLMIIGMKRKIKTVRILSLILFAITIIKLFAYDITNISDTGKTIAFILLGALLLIISFMYQKVKKLVTDNDSAEENTPIENNDNIINE